MSWRYFVRASKPDTSSGRGLKIWFDVRVGEATIVQMDAKVRHGDGATRKKGADRFEDDLMLGFGENVPAKRMQEVLPFFARGRLIAERSERTEFHIEL